MTQPFTRIGSRDTFILLRSDIPVDGMPDLFLVEYAPANDPEQVRMMPVTTWNKEMFRPLHPLVCSHCGGSGKDRDRPVKPCGYCFGSGWVNCEGEPLTRDTSTADTLLQVSRLIQELSQQANKLNHPRVQALFEEMETEAIARSETQWRNGKGAGPSGQRHTGD